MWHPLILRLRQPRPELRPPPLLIALKARGRLKVTGSSSAECPPSSRQPQRVNRTGIFAAAESRAFRPSAPSAAMVIPLRNNDLQAPGLRTVGDPADGLPTSRGHSEADNVRAKPLIFHLWTAADDADAKTPTLSGDNALNGSFGLGSAVQLLDGGRCAMTGGLHPISSIAPQGRP